MQRTDRYSRCAVFLGNQLLEVEESSFVGPDFNNSPVGHTVFRSFLFLSTGSASLPSGMYSLLLLLRGNDAFRELRLSVFCGLFSLKDSIAWVAQQLNSQGRSLSSLMEAWFIGSFIGYCGVLLQLSFSQVAVFFLTVGSVKWRFDATQLQSISTWYWAHKARIRWWPVCTFFSYMLAKEFENIEIVSAVKSLTP